jgi:hypothetical protein
VVTIQTNSNPANAFVFIVASHDQQPNDHARMWGTANASVRNYFGGVTPLNHLKPISCSVTVFS